jgi:hypothetical protein
MSAQPERHLRRTRQARVTVAKTMIKPSVTLVMRAAQVVESSRFGCGSSASPVVAASNVG